MKYLENFKNNIDFFVREHLPFSRRNYFERPEVKNEFVSQREKELFEKYNLISLRETTTVQNYKENLYFVDVLDKVLEIKQEENLKILDIGCKNWFYAKGEYFLFKKYSPSIILNGIELDANRLYSNFYSRAEAAKFYTKNLEGVNYIHGDFLKHKEKYDYIIWILPFVFENPHLKWGLPLKYLKPDEMLSHAYEALRENGKMFIINQGEDEYEEQKKICSKLDIPFLELGKIESEFFDYKYPRYGIIIENKH